MIKNVLYQLAHGQTLDETLATQVFEQVMTGQASEAQTAALLALIQARGPRPAEILGAARVMREKAIRVEAPEGLTIIDTCGTGGDQAGTFNISTAAAIVAAGAGRPKNVAVAKHGNRAMTSKSGSSQVLETLGVKLDVSGQTLTRCLDEAGMAFCYAPSHHPAMKYAGPVRQALGFRTIFNLVGPLTNPANASRQVMGIYDPAMLRPLAEVLKGLGTQRAMVVFGQLPDSAGGVVGFDELSTCGPSQVAELQDGDIWEYEIDPAPLGLPLALPHAFRADGPADSARIIAEVLDGKPGPAREIVALNAGAALVVADLAQDIQQGLQLAMQAMDDGSARNVLDTLVTLTHEEQTSP